jgi:bisanhydrobacterioruberin hydratase
MFSFSQLRTYAERYSLFILIVLHTVGVIGLSIPSTEYLFLACTPATLLICLILVVTVYGFGKTKDATSFWVHLIGAFCVGFGMEVLSTSTGIPFGHYTYGQPLGLKLAGVPLLIGVLWALLALGATSLLRAITPGWLRIMLAALLLTGFDALMEPAAIGLDFWGWEGGVISDRNYIGWFATGLLVCMPTVIYPLKRYTILEYIFIIQLIFFVIIQLLR